MWYGNLLDTFKTHLVDTFQPVDMYLFRYTFQRLLKLCLKPLKAISLLSGYPPLVVQNCDFVNYGNGAVCPTTDQVRNNTCKGLITLCVLRVALGQKTQIDLRLVHLKLIYE